MDTTTTYDKIIFPGEVRNNLTWVWRHREGGSFAARSLSSSSLLVQEIVSQVIVSCRLGTTKKRGTKRSMVGSTRRDRRRDALYNFSFKLTVFVNDWLSSPRLRLKIVLWIRPYLLWWKDDDLDAVVQAPRGAQSCLRVWTLWARGYTWTCT